KSRTGLGVAEDVAAQIVEGFEAGAIGFVRRDGGECLEAGNVACLTADDLERSLPGEAEETGAECGITDIDIARRGRDGDSLRNVDILDLEGQALSSEIAFGLGNVDRASRGDLGCAEFDSLRRRTPAHGPEQ